MLTVEKLARILAEEFDRDQWGDIDPWLFKEVARGGIDLEDADAIGLEQVLQRAVKRIKEQL